jgi:hypothetical protein
LRAQELLNPAGTALPPKTVLAQVERHNTIEPSGHLYGAVLASVRDDIEARSRGEYAEYHLGFSAQCMDDLSMPLHNTFYGALSAFNRRNHLAIEGTVNDEALDNFGRIRPHAVCRTNGVNGRRSCFIEVLPNDRLLQ